tara:strand:+ start:242 stop:763 length:522 start_codon:yes stop_codon:yes gene_type:complete
MAQEFTIKSQDIEDKINQLLPSQGGFQAGVDFSASTMVIPVVDLTETAEGSSLRQDLQTSFSLTTATNFNVNNTTSTLVNTTGYYRVYGTSMILDFAGGTSDSFIAITDGITTKKIYEISTIDVNLNQLNYQKFDFIIKLEAGHSITATVSQYNRLAGATRQLADINGNLTNP